MNKPAPTRYCMMNGKSCNEALKQRGSLLIWLDKDMVWRAPKARRPGRPPMFSDAAVQFCLMVKVLFGLPLRQTTGMVASILQMAGLDWPVPDLSTLSRRQKAITVQITHRRDPGPPNLLVDSMGIEFLGDGEWLARKHGTHRRRQ
ncbi:transposase (plasmid) [Paracoccus aminophilus JCM 7686]|uniref:Transposase n=1 Tax=Paracoccus aminophilus JCM 7686 TaxID=1367847 RepID=S5XU65_PARAH|nr:transposase [Paracoccus aminophilus JCM 7686]